MCPQRVQLTPHHPQKHHNPPLQPTQYPRAPSKSSPPQQTLWNFLRPSPSTPLANHPKPTLTNVPPAELTQPQQPTDHVPSSPRQHQVLNLTQSQAPLMSQDT